MVNLSIDPPPFGRSTSSSSSGGNALGRYIVWLALLVIVFGAGLYVGRRSATHGRFSVAEVGPGGDAAVTGAPETAAPGAKEPSKLGRPAAPAAPQAGAPVPAPGTAVAAQPAPAATPPAAPQGPLVRRATVVLRGALEESIQAALPPEERAWGEQLTQVTNRLLVWNLQVAHDGRKGDKLEILYELPTPQPTEIAPVGAEGPAGKEPVILALRYGSQKLGKLLTAYRFKPEGAPFARYYTAEGQDVEEHLVDSPVEGYEQITSLLRDGRRHKGVDFKTPVGTAVKAPFDGTISRRNWKWTANGNCLELIDPKTGRHAIFLHLEAAPKEMQPGRAVKKGEEIAKSGNTGHSTAPHLHFQLEDAGGKVLDPFAVMAIKHLSLEGPQKAAFDTERAKLEPMLVAAAK